MLTAAAGNDTLVGQDHVSRLGFDTLGVRQQLIYETFTGLAGSWQRPSLGGAANDTLVTAAPATTISSAASAAT